MKATEDESAALKWALKHRPETPELVNEAVQHQEEAVEALQEVFRGLDDCSPDSWVGQSLITPVVHLLCQLREGV